LTVDDFNLSRLQVIEPGPIPPRELERTYEWMLGWRLLDPETTPDALVNATVQAAAHPSR